MSEREVLQQYEAQAVPVCGWPMWRRKSKPAGVVPHEADLVAHAEFYLAHEMEEHILLCLWREHCREWLEMKGHYLRPIFCSEGFVGWGVYSQTDHWATKVLDGYAKPMERDAALIAAIVNIGRTENDHYQRRSATATDDAPGREPGQ